MGFSIYAWITIVTLLVTFGILLFTKLRSDLVFLSVIGVLFVTGVLNVNEALSGFSSTTVAVVGVMFVVVAGLTYTGVLHWIIKNMLGRPKNYRNALLRLTIPVAVLSPFLNTATVVTMFVGVVKMWAKKVKMMPSKLLIPICLAGNMGAVCVILVLPSNLVISGFYERNSGHDMSVFAPAIPGLFGLLAGILTMIALRRLLPDRKAPEAAFESTGDYTVELLVPSDNPHIAKRVGPLGLNNVAGGSLIELRHFDDDKIMSPVPDREPLMGGDRLVYAGQIDELLELKKKYGLVSADHYVFHYNEVDTTRQLRTAYINFGSSLINTKIGNGTFERDNNVTLVAVARRGKRIEQAPREVVLQAGDTLLLECPPHMNIDTTSLGQQLQFFDSTDVPDISRHTIISTAIMILMVTLTVSGVMTLLQSAFIAAGAMLIFRCCSPSQAMNAIKWNLLASLAGSITLGLAIQKTGIATWISHGILSISGSHPLIVMIAVCLVAAFITEFLSNTAVAAIIVPIMYSAATQLGYDPLPFLVALIMAANSSFATPIGSSVNMLVFGPGGYRFSDFIRIGVPVKFAFLTVSIIIVIILYPLKASAQDETIVFTPQWTAQAQFAGYYVAEAKGFYREAGVKVRIEHPTATQPVSSRLQNKRCQATTLQLLQAMEIIDSGIPLVNILQTSMNNAMVIVSARGKGPLPPKGASVGIWRSNFSQLAVCMSNQKHLNYQWVQFAQDVNLFVAGALDAMLAMSYNEYYQLVQAGVKMSDKNVYRFCDHGYNVQEDGVYMTREYYMKHKDQAHRFAQASRKGWEWVAEHPDEALDIVMQYVDKNHIATNRVMQRLMLKEVLRLQVDRESKKREFRLRPDMVKRSSRLMVENKMLSREITYEELCE